MTGVPDGERSQVVLLGAWARTRKASRESGCRAPVAGKSSLNSRTESPTPRGTNQGRSNALESSSPSERERYRRPTTSTRRSLGRCQATRATCSSTATGVAVLQRPRPMAALSR